MKKILLSALLISFTVGTANAFEYLGPTNEATRNITPIMKRQFEKNETLDFVNKPEEYKIKREKREAYQDYQEGKTNYIPAQYAPRQIPASPFAPATNMQFTTDDNGQIRIQGIR